MTYTKLREPHINCSFVGIASPLLLRAESRGQHGGVRVSEFQDRPPHVEIDGESSDARACFRRVLSSVSRYLDPRNFMRETAVLDYPGRLDLDLRYPDHRILLAEGGAYQYRLIVCGDPSDDRIRNDIYQAVVRLHDLYQIFYGL